MSGRLVARKLIVFMASSLGSHHRKQKHYKAKEQHGMLSDTRVRLISTRARAAYISSVRCAMRVCVRVRPSIHAVSVIASPYKNVIIKLTRRPVAYGYLEHEDCRNDELFFCYLIDFNGNVVVHCPSYYFENV